MEKQKLFQTLSLPFMMALLQAMGLKHNGVNIF